MLDHVPGELIDRRHDTLNNLVERNRRQLDDLQAPRELSLAFVAVDEQFQCASEEWFQKVWMTEDVCIFLLSTSNSLSSWRIPSSFSDDYLLDQHQIQRIDKFPELNDSKSPICWKQKVPVSRHTTREARVELCIAGLFISNDRFESVSQILAHLQDVFQRTLLHANTDRLQHWCLQVELLHDHVQFRRVCDSRRKRSQHAQLVTADGVAEITFSIFYWRTTPNLFVNPGAGW